MLLALDILRQILLFLIIFYENSNFIHSANRKYLYVSVHISQYIHFRDKNAFLEHRNNIFAFMLVNNPIDL